MDFFWWNLPIFKCRKLIKICMKHYRTKWKQSTLPSQPRSADWLSWQPPRWWKLLGPSGRRTRLPPGLITDQQQPDFGRLLKCSLDLNFFFYRSQGWSERISLVCVSSKMHFLGISVWSFLLTNFHKIIKSCRGIPTVATGILLTVLVKGISSSSTTFRTFFSPHLLPICSPSVPCFSDRPTCSGTPACVHIQNLYSSAPWPWKHLEGSESLFHVDQ